MSERVCSHGRGFICNRISFDAVTPFVYTAPVEFVIRTGSFCIYAFKSRAFSRSLARSRTHSINLLRNPTIILYFLTYFNLSNHYYYFFKMNNQNNVFNIISWNIQDLKTRLKPTKQTISNTKLNINQLNVSYPNLILSVSKKHGQKTRH